MEFRALGPLEVRHDGRVLAIGAAEQRALLGVLLLHAGETISVDRLVDELWGEHPPASAAKPVQATSTPCGAASAGRRWRLGPRATGSNSGRARSTRDFERLLAEAADAQPERAAELRRSALALWRGPPLSDIRLEGPTAYEAGRLEELRLTAQLDLFDDELALGRHAALVGDLETLARLHPYQERLHGQLMLALYRSGRQADTLEAYASLRRSLRDELGLEPGPALRALETAILRQEPALGEPGADGARGGRAGARRAASVSVLVAGVVGATRLGELLAPDEAAALLGECHAQMNCAVEEYGGIVQAYEGDGIRGSFGSPAHENDPARAARAALRILEVAGAYAHDGRGRRCRRRRGRVRGLARGVEREWPGRRRRRGVQWADAATRELAEAVLGLTDRAPVLLVLTLRRDPASDGGTFAPASSTGSPHRASELDLGPLPPDASRTLLDSLLPGAVDDVAAEEIVARAEGNPLYLEELLRTLVEGGSSSGGTGHGRRPPGRRSCSRRRSRTCS